MRRDGGQAGPSIPDTLTLHADRGTPMTSKPVALLLADLGITRSHSRPHVSNDNPYSARVTSRRCRLAKMALLTCRFGRAQGLPRGSLPSAGFLS